MWGGVGVIIYVDFTKDGGGILDPMKVIKFFYL